MVRFNLSIINPWCSGNVKNIYHADGNITKNKGWEFQIYRYAPELLSIEFRIKHRCDHAGILIGFGLFGYTVEFSFYDGRHWDDTNNCYEVYPENE